MTDSLDPNMTSIVKIKELFQIYQDLFLRLEAPEDKMKDQMAVIRRLLDSGSVENIKNFLNELNNTQTKLVNEVRDLNVAYTKLRNAVK